MLAGLPVVGKLAGAEPKPENFVDLFWRDPQAALPGLVSAVKRQVMAEPVTHYVGTYYRGLSAYGCPNWHPTVAEALEHVVEGRGGQDRGGPGARGAVVRKRRY